MELGPIQKQWIKNLRDNPNMQLKNQLGICDNGKLVKACCLGMLLHTYNEANGIEDTVIAGSLYCNIYADSAYALENYEQLGLYGSGGNIAYHPEDPNSMDSLATMNDSGKTWPEIADFVEQHPDNVFTKSY